MLESIVSPSIVFATYAPGPNITRRVCYDERRLKTRGASPCHRPGTAPPPSHTVFPAPQQGGPRLLRDGHPASSQPPCVERRQPSRASSLTTSSVESSPKDSAHCSPRSSSSFVCSFSLRASWSTWHLTRVGTTDREHGEREHPSDGSLQTEPIRV